MKGYKQLTYDERIKIAQMKQSSLSIGRIASTLRRSKSTISRELRRNQAPPGEYWPDTAQGKALKRCQRVSRLDKNQALQDFVVTQLTCHYWTPEQIAGWLNHRQEELPCISHESIYSWLYKGKQKKEKLWKFLPRHKAKRGLRKTRGSKKSPIPNRVSIHERPQVVSGKKEFGHWEGDLMAFQKNSQHIVVLRERKSMFTLSRPLLSKKAQETAKVIVKLTKGLPPHARKTMTYDNGGEFADHLEVTQAIGLPAYFCDPYASWQKGGVENTNGRLRRDLPRRINVRSMTEVDFNEIIDNYNTTPRKNLGWFTPIEIFNKNSHSVALHT